MEFLCCLATGKGPQKHPCGDCRYCQFCSDSRCRTCRGKGFSRPRGISEQIASFDALNKTEAVKPYEPIFLTPKPEGAETD